MYIIYVYPCLHRYKFKLSDNAISEKRFSNGLSPLYIYIILLAYSSSRIIRDVEKLLMINQRRLSITCISKVFTALNFKLTGQNRVVFFKIIMELTWIGIIQKIIIKALISRVVWFFRKKKQ